MTSSRSKGRPTSTSALVHPPSQTEALPVLSSFSPNAKFFAFVVLAVDKHRLRVYDTASGRAVSEHTVDSARVAALQWTTLPELPTEGRSSPSKKRKKTAGEQVAKTGTGEEVIALGLSNGIIVFFSPTHSNIVYTLSHPTSNSAITSLAFHATDRLSLWTSSADSAVRLWNIQKNTLVGSWKGDDRIPPTAISVCPTNQDNVDLLIAHHSIRLLSIDASSDQWSGKPKQMATFTGHATSIQRLLWAREAPSTHFFSTAIDDRSAYYWDIEGASSNQKPLASIALESDVRTIALSPSSQSPQTLIALSASGKVSFIPIPSEIPSSAGDKPSKIQSFLPRASVSSVSKSRSSDPPVIDLVPLPDDPGAIRVVRLARGVQPVFNTIRYLDDSSTFIEKPVLEEVPENLPNDGPSVVLPNKRYIEPKSLALGSGMDVDRNEDSGIEDEAEGALQVDLAELSLGQRLTAVTEDLMDAPSDSEDENAASRTTGRPKSKKQSADIPAIPTNSLARTLIQALHSSDSRLLEMCLAHSDSALILNTVRRLPPQLAVSLITACVERLGRGPRSANMKGGGGGASSQRGMGLLTWLRTVMMVHIGHLMTLPDLVARLSGLHATLTARLSLHESLLSLSGRLDMVLNQVELRAATAPAALPSKTDKKKPETHVRQYVEGETDSDDEVQDKMDVEDGDHDEGSIEDIELGADTEDEDDEDEDEDEESLSGDDIEGFIDDEADEFTGDDEDEDSE